MMPILQPAPPFSAEGEGSAAGSPAPVLGPGGRGAGGGEGGAVGADEGEVLAVVDGRGLLAAVGLDGFGGVEVVENCADLDHVLHRDALGDAADELDARRGGLEDGVAGAAGGD